MYFGYLNVGTSLRFGDGTEIELWQRSLPLHAKRLYHMFGLVVNLVWRPFERAILQRGGLNLVLLTARCELAGFVAVVPV